MSDRDKPKNDDDFAAKAAAGRTGLASEFVAFLKDNKKWWLAPIIISILGLGVLVMLGGTPRDMYAAKAVAEPNCFARFVSGGASAEASVHSALQVALCSTNPDSVSPEIATYCRVVTLSPRSWSRKTLK